MTRLPLRIIAKMKETAKMFPPQTYLEIPTYRTATVTFPDGTKEKVVVMSNTHSMFMNCVPLTKDQLGADVLEKIHSVIQNTLFKSAKFYPQPIMLMPSSGSVCMIAIIDCPVFKAILQGQKCGMPFK